MKKFKKVLAFMLMFTMVLQTLCISASATEQVTSADYNHGTITISTSDTDGTITLTEGETCEITISPYVHVQYEGCQKEGCPGPDVCGGEECFEVGKGCKCSSTPVKRTATVTATAEKESVVDIGIPEIKTTLESDEVGNMANGSLILTAKEAGESKVTVSASLCDWISVTKEYNVIVNKVEEENPPATDVNDWVEIDQIEGATDISAKGFAVRKIDSEGNVTSAKYFTEAEMKTLAQKYGKKPYYYTFGCGMKGYPSLSKGEGVKLTDLLNEAGIAFQSGQKMMLRATDRLASEMGIETNWRTGKLSENTTEEQRTEWEKVLADTSIATKNAYYTYFTYDYLMGISRYSFAEGMANAMLKNPEMTQSDLYNSKEVIASKTEVEPLLCFGFGQIYANTVTSANDVKNISMNRGDAYRFCFGQAMDGEAISSANTRMQTAYNVFGIDIIDTEKAPAMALDDIALAGQKVIFTFTAEEGACTDGSDFADSINTVVVKDSNGTEKTLTADQYETSYNRLQKEDGSYYYIGVLTIKEGIFDKIGSYTVTVSANTYGDAQTTVEVQESQQAPVLKSNKVTLRYTTDPLTIKVTDGTANWANNIRRITIIDAAGNEKILDSEQYNVTESAISLIRTEEDPIMSVSTENRTAEYRIKVESVGYTTLEDTLTATMYGANSFQVRVVDSNGNVVKTRTFTMDEIKELSDKSDAYYNTICGMSGIRTFKANGISLSKLLETAGVTFDEGMTLKLRTNDSAESENDSITNNAYFRLGSFTYEDLLGTDRYYFSGIFEDETLKDTLLNGSKFGDDVKLALGGAKKELVEPMFAYDYVEKVYRSTEGANLTEDTYNSLVGTENAFRFLFGIAMDPEDSSMISGTTTTWSASYAVFGIDIVDPSYDELVPIKKYDAYTDHAKSADYVSGDDTQSLHVSLTFAEKMKIVDKDALLAEMQLSLGGSPLSAEKNVVLDAKLSEDGETLDIIASGWFAAYSGKFQSVGKWSNLVSVEDSTCANAEIAFYVPNGLKTVIKAQTAATENKNAMVETQIVAPQNVTRGMVHLLLLKNGKPALETNAHGGIAVGHFHNYMTMTAEDFVKNIESTLKDALGEAYMVTVEADTITITEEESQPGDVLELHIISYLNMNNKNIDKTELDTLLKEIESLDASVYTKETMELLNTQVDFAQIIQNSEYYSQEDVDCSVEKLLEAKNALKVIESVDNPSNPDENKDNDSNVNKPDGNGASGTTGGNGASGTTGGNGVNGTASGNNVKTGDTAPIELFVLLMMISATSLFLAKKKQKNA